MSFELLPGIVWSFRFPSIGSLSRRSKASLSQPVARPHIDTQRWLSVLDLDQYSEQFRKFDGVEVRNPPGKKDPSARQLLH